MTLIKLEEVPTVPVGDLSALPASELSQLINEAKLNVDKYKHIHEWLSGALNLKYQDSFNQNRNAQGKPTGIVRIEEDGYVIAQDIAKKPKWDKNKLNDIIENIKRQGDDPAEYVEVTYKVSENNFKSWPQFIKKVFEPARTEEYGNPTYKLTPKKEEA